MKIGDKVRVLTLAGMEHYKDMGIDVGSEGIITGTAGDATMLMITFDGKPYMDENGQDDMFDPWFAFADDEVELVTA